MITGKQDGKLQINIHTWYLTTISSTGVLVKQSQICNIKCTLGTVEMLANAGNNGTISFLTEWISVKQGLCAQDNIDDYEDGTFGLLVWYHQQQTNGVVLV